MSEYVRTASDLNGPGGLGAILLCEVFDRLKAGIYGPNKMPRHISAAAWIDAGYQLDAPDTMPAGGCRGYTLPDFADLYPDDPMAAVVAEQLMVERDEAPAVSGAGGKDPSRSSRQDDKANAEGTQP